MKHVIEQLRHQTVVELRLFRMVIVPKRGFDLSGNDELSLELKGSDELVKINT